MERMRPPHVLTLASLAIFLPLSGCTGAECEGVFEGADIALCNAVGGSETATETFEVPDGSDKLTIKRNFAGGGQVEYALKDPTGATVKEGSFNGGQAASDTWYEKTSPRAGTWTITVTVNGGASYTFGVYY